MGPYGQETQLSNATLMRRLNAMMECMAERDRTLHETITQLQTRVEELSFDREERNPPRAYASRAQALEEQRRMLRQDRMEERPSRAEATAHYRAEAQARAVDRGETYTSQQPARREEEGGKWRGGGRTPGEPTAYAQFEREGELSERRRTSARPTTWAQVRDQWAEKDEEVESLSGASQQEGGRPRQSGRRETELSKGSVDWTQFEATLAAGQAAAARMQASRVEPNGNPKPKPKGNAKRR